MPFFPNGSSGGGIGSINGSSAEAQTIVGSGTISVVSSGGTTTISSTGSGGVTSINTQSGALTIAGTGSATVTNVGTAFTINSASGVSSVGTIGSQTASANGAVIVGSALYMQPASATAPGLVTTGAQTIAGAKTFASGSNATIIDPTYSLQNSEGNPGVGFSMSSTTAAASITASNPASGAAFYLGNDNGDATAYLSLAGSSASTIGNITTSPDQLQLNNTIGNILIEDASNNSLATVLTGATGFVFSVSAAPSLLTLNVGTSQAAHLTCPHNFQFTVGSSLRMTVKTNTLNVSLPSYATDAAAGTAGLVTGDLYINTTASTTLSANVVCSKV